MSSVMKVGGWAEQARDVPAGHWAVQPKRSNVAFTIKHLMVATVRGVFERFDAVLETDASGLVSASGVVDATSVTTGDGKRDEVLLGRGFLDGEGHPDIRFESREIHYQESGTVHLLGDLTIKGLTRPVELTGAVTVLGSAGAERLAVDVRGQLSRSEFGVTGGGVIERSGAAVSDTVKIEIHLTAERVADQR